MIIEGKNPKHFVVFDGTSAYILPSTDDMSDLEILGKFEDMDRADDFCEQQNDEIQDK